jgi:alpha-beta hydrolase superfamily lysophospholipase
MIEENIEFTSNGLKLSGVVGLPSDLKPGEKRPAMLVLHGFGSTKNAQNVMGPVKELGEMGYITLRFDMQGCGESEGRRGHLLCLDQVQNTQDAWTRLNAHPSVQASRVGVMGSSFGAAVAMYAGAIDERVAVVISSGGWGHGERKFKGQHHTKEAWRNFRNMLLKGRRHQHKTGEPLMVDRHEIVPIPHGLTHQVVHGSLQKFTHETAQSMMDFKAEEVIHQLAPRPLLLLNSSSDSVTPTEQSIEIFKKASAHADLHLFADTDHFMLAEGNRRVWHVVADWLALHLPLQAVTA